MLHFIGRLISIKYAAFCKRENRAKFQIYEKRAVLSTPLLLKIAATDLLHFLEHAVSAINLILINRFLKTIFHIFLGSKNHEKIKDYYFNHLKCLPLE